MPPGKLTPEQVFRAKTGEITGLLREVNKRLEVYDHNQRLIYTELQAFRGVLTDLVRGQGGRHALELVKEGTRLANAIGKAWRPWQP